ncbi:hypothetical protein [Kribbella sp. NPDC000426]|uniref:hypothetical protein n=1 Tax=Kribbella sp. NPDC000426 TaxID=3154255 RepID=UPI00331B1BB7
MLIANGVQPAPAVEAGAAAQPGPGRWLVRTAVYLCGTVVVVLVAIVAGADYYTRTECTEDGDCLAVLGGFVWGAVAVLACGLAVLVIEIGLWRRRRRKTAEVGGG